MAKEKASAKKAATKETAVKKAATKKTTAANVETAQTTSGFDPKNRLVELIPGKTCTVRKKETGFEKTGLTKAAALELFKQQVDCSHNQ